MRHIGRTELASTRVGIHIEDLVDDGVKIHESGVFSQVIFWLAQECICLTIAAMDRDFARFCERLHDLYLVCDICKVCFQAPSNEIKGKYITIKRWRVRGEWLMMRVYSRRRWGKSSRQQLLEGHNQRGWHELRQVRDVPFHGQCGSPVNP